MDAEVRSVEFSASSSRDLAFLISLCRNGETTPAVCIPILLKPFHTQRSNFYQILEFFTNLFPREIVGRSFESKLK